jgi:hypothetical protein
MKKVVIAIAALLAAGNVFAQSDSTSSKADTIKVGNFIIIKKDKKGSSSDRYSSDSDSVKVTKRKKSNVSTNWSIIDIGFANVRDETAYGSAEANGYLRGGATPFTKDDMKLRTTKSSNVNFWLFMQKVNVSKHVLNLKYGLGLEMYNFRYSKNISYRENLPGGVTGVFRDTVQFSKNKLYAGYITVPFMINVNTTPGRKRGFSFSAGVSAGYLVGSRNKQISNERGKQKIKGDFDLEKWRVAYIAELGLGPIRLYGSYSMNPLHERGLKQYPYAVGLRLSNW